METGLIYSIICTVDKKRYIGLTTQTLAKRWKDHVSESRSNPSSHLHRAIAKYGSHNFNVRVIEEDIKLDQLPEREQYWIAEFDTFNNGYNQTTGGETSKTLHDDVKEKISESMLGVSKSPEHTDNMRKTLKERKITFTSPGDGTHHKRKIKGMNVKTKEIKEVDSTLEAARFLGKSDKASGAISRAISKGYMAYGYTWERLDDTPNKKSVKGYGKWTGELVYEFESMNKASLELTGHRSNGIKRSLNNPGKSTWKGCYWYYA